MLSLRGRDDSRPTGVEVREVLGRAPRDVGDFVKSGAVSGVWLDRARHPGFTES
ncbi:hypothetical protein GCM10023347_38230 [Streptomyces chumphonensis]